jgi:hypothetical protein
VRTWRSTSLVALPVVAALYQGALVSRANNDTFLHLAMSRQVLHGDLPVRDFFDSGLVLMYATSAAAQQLLGYRLLSEAIVVALAVGLATLLAGHLVHRLTGSIAGALFAQLLILLAAPRPYSYPKLILYAVAATLWWAYMARPTTMRASVLGAWTAVAFYFRPDHGVYIAVGVAITALAVEGVSAKACRHLGAAGAACVLLVAPWFLFVQRTIGFADYLTSGMAQGVAEELETSGHALPPWPVRRWSDVVRLEPAETFAPVISLRWTAGSSDAARREVLARYQLAATSQAGDVTRARVSRLAADHVSELLREPLIEDTAGIDRSASELVTSGWPWWQRLAFRHPALGLRILPVLDDQRVASDATTVLFQLVPVLAILAAGVWRRRLTGLVTAPRLIAFAVATLVVNAGLIRTPYDVRTVDAVVLPALLAGCGLAALQALARQRGRLARVAVGVVMVSGIVLLTRSVASAGEFGDRMWYLTGEWRGTEHLRGAWAEVRGRLVTSPPADFWRSGTGPAAVQLAQYARECLPPGERLMVLWFAPEIYYYSDRLMAQRNLVFIAGWSALTGEQELTLEKVRRSAPALVFASAPRLDTVTKATYPSVVEYVHAHYQPVGTVAGDEDYVILARRDRPAVRAYGEHEWPCYAYQS